jgi:hypothetical protein
MLEMMKDLKEVMPEALRFVYGRLVCGRSLVDVASLGSGSAVVFDTPLLSTCHNASNNFHAGPFILWVGDT